MGFGFAHPDGDHKPKIKIWNALAHAGLEPLLAQKLENEKG
jgi:hypothetical protein